MGRFLAALKRIEGRQAPGDPAPPLPADEHADDLDDEGAVSEPEGVVRGASPCGEDGDPAPDYSPGTDCRTVLLACPSEPAPAASMEPEAAIRDTSMEAVAGETLVEPPSPETLETPPGLQDEPQTPGSDSPEADFQAEIQRLLARRNTGRDPGYCQMAANILAQAPPGRPAVLLFAAVSGEEAAARTLAPLAAVLGETVRGPVLAVDARAQGPELSACFGVCARRGLGDVLGGAARWQDAVRATPLGNLHLLPGSESDTAARWSPSPGAVADLLEQVRRHYRLVLVDGGSLDQAPAARMARLCDGVYLVVHLGRTPRKAVLEAMDAVRRAGGRVLGCVAAGE